ncbi:hypothetical protein ID866_9487 [Astraeus odoratus]|nr:hypothetical protein ID866_9487 [Astraeus odoratus]
MDPKPSLEEFARHASRYSINLDGLVERDKTIYRCGGQATVFKGTLKPPPGCESLNVSRITQVAIKTVRCLPHDKFTAETTLREVHLWSKLRHDNVLKLLGIVTEFDNTISIISEWMDKGDAHDYVQDRDIDPRPLILDIAKGLEYLHAHKPGPIYHGDLKGANVLISKNGHALLTDFGFSHISNSSFSLAPLTASGGTLHFMPPESLRCENYENYTTSAAGDVWAFGITALELFTGKIPFQNIWSLPLLQLRILRGPPDRPGDEESRFRMTDEWWSICTSCWASDPSSRPQMADVVEDVRRIFVSFLSISLAQ